MHLSPHTSLRHCNNRKIPRIATTPVSIPKTFPFIPKPWKTFSLSIVEWNALSQLRPLTRDAFQPSAREIFREHIPVPCVPPRFREPFPKRWKFSRCRPSHKFTMKFVNVKRNAYRVIYPIYGDNVRFQYQRVTSTWRGGGDLIIRKLSFRNYRFCRWYSRKFCKVNLYSWNRLCGEGPFTHGLR